MARKKNIPRLGAYSGSGASFARTTLLSRSGTFGMLLCGGLFFARLAVAQGPVASSPKAVLIIPPHAPFDDSEKLPANRAIAISDAVSSRISKLGMGYTPVLGKWTRCKFNYECWAKENASLTHDSIAWVVDVSVQEIKDSPFRLQVFLFDVAHPTSERADRPKFASGPSGRAPNLTDDKALAETIADSVNRLFQQVQQGATESEPEKVVVKPAAHSRMLDLEVAVSGPGQVVSRPESLVCKSGQVCQKTFSVAGASSTAATDKQEVVTLLAQPAGAASVVKWSGSPCRNSTLDGARRCELMPSSSRLQVKVGFERSSARKIAAGTLGALAGLSLVTTGVFLGLSGRDAGSCTVGGQTFSSGCVYNLGPSALVTAGLTVAFGVGAAVVWWAPSSTTNGER